MRRAYRLNFLLRLKPVMCDAAVQYGLV